MSKECNPAGHRRSRRRAPGTRPARREKARPSPRRRSGQLPGIGCATGQRARSADTPGNAADPPRGRPRSRRRPATADAQSAPRPRTGRPRPSLPRPRGPPGYEAPSEMPASSASARQCPVARGRPPTRGPRRASDPGPRPSRAPPPQEGHRAGSATSPRPDRQRMRECAPDAPCPGRGPERAASTRRRARDPERESGRIAPVRPPARRRRARTSNAPSRAHPEQSRHPNVQPPRPCSAQGSAPATATNRRRGCAT